MSERVNEALIKTTALTSRDELHEYIDQSIEKFIKAMAVAGAVFESTGSVKSHKCPALLDELPRQA